MLVHPPQKQKMHYLKLWFQYHHGYLRQLRLRYQRALLHHSPVLLNLFQLKTNPSPSRAEIRAAISNICRCGTYPRVEAAVLRAAEIAREG